MSADSTPHSELRPLTLDRAKHGRGLSITETKELAAEIVRLQRLEEQLANTCPDCGIPEVWCRRVTSNPQRCWRWDYEQFDEMASRLTSLEEQLEAAEEYADEGWAWLGAALHALGVSNVFEIPDWQENLRKSNAEMASEKALAASNLANKFGTSPAEESGRTEADPARDS